MKPDLYDIVVLLGILIFCSGLWLINPAVSLCALGVELTVVGLIGAAAKKGGDKR